MAAPARSGHVAAVIIMLLLAGATALSAQDTALTETILAVRVSRGPERTLVAMSRGRVAYLPLREVLELVEVRVTASDSAHVEAVLEPGSVALLVDALGAARRRGMDSTALEPDEVVSVGGVLYARSELVGWLLDVSIMVDWVELVVSMIATEHLPVIRRLEREARRAALAAAPTRLPPAERALAARTSLLEGAVVDWGLQFGTERPLEQHTMQLGAGIQLAGGSLEYSATRVRAVDGTTVQDRWSWLRAWESGPVRQLAAGHIFTEGPRLRALRGARVSNQPFVRPADFDADLITGRLGPGWDVELYQYGQLRAFAATDSTGEFRVSVPLYYGFNLGELRAYGPNGEVLRRQFAVDVAESRLPARRAEYALAYGECLFDPCRNHGSADLRAGLTPRLTARAGVEWFDGTARGESWHPYASASLALGTSLQLEAEAVARGATRLRAKWRRGPDFEFSLGLSRFDSLSGSLFGGGRDQGRQETGFFWRPGGGALVLRASWFRADVAGGQRSTVRLSPSFRFSNATLSITAGEDRSRAGLISTVSNYDAMLTLLLRRPRWLRYGLLSVTMAAGCAGPMLGCNPSSQQSRVAISRQMTSTVRVEAGYAWRRSTGAVLDLSVNANLPYLRFIHRGSAGGGRGTQGVQNFDGSLLLDRRAGVLRTGDGRSLGRAGVAGVVFYDSNGNGAQDEGEDGVPELLLRIGARGVITDSSGRFHTFDMVPFIRTVVELDTLSLPDPTWVPVASRFTMVPAANGYLFVAIPLQRGGEVSGSVELGGVGVAGARIQLQSEDGALV
ncbi:MAG TPA: hypothetical protein VNL98_11350, partial [Gemmatimonadales bacterium]|nr:hypothetical protein [Gemmatimonadales bacterium]